MLADGKVNIVGDKLEAVSWYGYSFVLQHVGIELSLSASFRLHKTGEIDLVAMSPASYRASGVSNDAEKIADVGSIFSRGTWPRRVRAGASPTRSSSGREACCTSRQVGSCGRTRCVRGGAEQSVITGMRAGLSADCEDVVEQLAILNLKQIKIPSQSLG